MKNLAGQKNGMKTPNLGITCANKNRPKCALGTGQPKAQQMVKYHGIITESCIWKSTAIPKSDIPRAWEYQKIKSCEYSSFRIKAMS